MAQRSIVVIEDDVSLSKVITEELREANFEVHQAFDGEAGLALVRNQRPDLVLLDLLLPKMHGFQVLQAVRQAADTSTIPIVIFTMISEEKVISEGLALGANDYLVKSQITLKSIVERIKQILQIQ